MDKVSFGHEDVAPAEKTRRVGAVFSQRRLALRSDERSDVGRPAPAVEARSSSAGSARARARRSSTWPAAPATSPSASPAPGAAVTVADINPEMLAVGVERAKARGIEGLVWAEENAERLSFADKSFDAYTIAFGIRNVTDIPAALREAHRVLKTGGRFFCLEFSRTRWPGFATLYESYARRDRAEDRQGGGEGRGQLSLPDRIDRALPRHAGLRAR